MSSLASLEGAEGILPLIAALTAELRGLRQELGELRQELGEFRHDQRQFQQALATLAESTAAGSAPRSTPLAAQAERLNQEVWRRIQAGQSSESHTDMDLLIDRLHDLALEDGAGLGQSGAVVAPPADGGHSPQPGSDHRPSG